MLGIVQGFTELFPVSSSAHLVILQSFFPDFHQPGVVFDVILHLGTLTAVILYFRNDIINILKSLLSHQDKTGGNRDGPVIPRKLALLLVMGTIPIAVAGFLFREHIHSIFESARAAAFFLLVTGCLLFFSDKVKATPRDLKDMTILDAILIGIAQSIALLPGISRSGSTITAGIFLKINRTSAARFSFLLSIPAVCGAVVLEAGHLKYVSPSDFGLYVVGFVCAAISGVLSLKLFFLVIRRARLKYFSYYCWFVGILTLMIVSP